MVELELKVKEEEKENKKEHVFFSMTCVCVMKETNNHNLIKHTKNIKIKHQNIPTCTNLSSQMDRCDVCDYVINRIIILLT